MTVSGPVSLVKTSLGPTVIASIRKPLNFLRFLLFEESAYLLNKSKVFFDDMMTTRPE
jgi:hypothetical protein